MHKDFNNFEIDLVTSIFGKYRIDYDVYGECDIKSEEFKVYLEDRLLSLYEFDTITADNYNNIFDSYDEILKYIKEYKEEDLAFLSDFSLIKRKADMEYFMINNMKQLVKTFGTIMSCSFMILLFILPYFLQNTQLLLPLFIGVVKIVLGVASISTLGISVILYFTKSKKIRKVDREYLFYDTLCITVNKLSDKGLLNTQNLDVLLKRYCMEYKLTNFESVNSSEVFKVINAFRCTEHLIDSEFRNNKLALFLFRFAVSYSDSFSYSIAFLIGGIAITSSGISVMYLVGIIILALPLIVTVINILKLKVSPASIAKVYVRRKGMDMVIRVMQDSFNDLSSMDSVRLKSHIQRVSDGSFTL